MDVQPDQFGDFVRNSTEPNFHPTVWFWSRELVKVLLSIAAIISNALIIYAVVTLRKVKEPRYFHLLNLGVTGTLCAFISPYMLFLIHVVIDIDLDDEEYDGIVCLILQVESAFLFINFVIVLLLTFDWLISNFLPLRMNFYKDKFVIVRVVFYIFGALYIWFSSVYCLSNWRGLHRGTHANCLVFLTFYVAALHIFHYVYARRSHLLLRFDFTIILPTAFVLCWLPYLLVHFTVMYDTTGNLSTAVYFLAECTTYANPIVNVFLLARGEDQLREKFLQVVKCRFRQQLENDGV